MSKCRIAVVAIHGVGDHQPAEMAKSVGNVLEELADDHHRPRYTAFTESTVRLNVAPVKVEGRAFDSPSFDGRPEGSVEEGHTWGPMDALYRSHKQVRGAVESDTNSIDHLFMEGQLAKYRGEEPDDTYECLRLEGERRAKAPVGPEEDAGAHESAYPDKTVHIYDMFWSDLSGVGKSGLRIFGEIYQLLFHLGSVGLNNLKAAALSFPKDAAVQRAWRRFNNAQNFVVALLAWPIPILNLLILACVLGLFATAALNSLSGTAQLVATGIVFLVIVLGLSGYLFSRIRRLSDIGFRVPVLLFLVACGALVWGVVAYATDINENVSGNNSPLREWTQGVALIMVLAGALFGIWQIMCAYEKRRPGTKKAFDIIAGIAVLCSAASLIARPINVPLEAMTISLRFGEITLWLLLLSWLVFWFGMIWAAFTAIRAMRVTAKKEPNEAGRARRVAWTARLTITLPVLLFLLLTFAAWAAISGIGVRLLPGSSLATGTCRADVGYNEMEPVCTPTSEILCHTSLIPPEETRFVSCWANDALVEAGITGIPLLLLFTCIAAVISIWGLFPSVMDEVSPPRGKIPDLAAKAHLQGDWLDRGYRFIRWGGELLYAGVLLFPLLMIFGFIAVMKGWFSNWVQLGTDFSATLGTIVAGSGVGLLALGGRFSKLALGFRPIVRVALDVDNWLREHPRDSNPTARICGRYASLLRYISQWRDDEGKPYQALIIFAHSQGTVITADLLRFLRTEANARGGFRAYDSSLADLDRLPVYLFTMGCPLRQLYGLRFPYLYGYVPTAPGAATLPDPDDLGVSLWVNAYRTADYVGRDLWRTHPWQPIGKISDSTWNPAAGMPKHVWAQGKRVEFSIGPGAHTHYWDETAEAIAEALDVLIARAPFPNLPAPVGGQNGNQVVETLG